jgi:transcriptional regulator NrdR family protein
MSPVEAKALRRLQAALQKELDKLRELKTEQEGVDIETAHPRVLGSLLHDLYTGMERFGAVFTQFEQEMTDFLKVLEDLAEQLESDLE